MRGNTCHVDDDSAEWRSVIDDLNSLPWIVWRLQLLDPDERVDAETVAERTKGPASAAADLYGCVYEYCVDEDTNPDGTKYYAWYIGVSQSESRQLIDKTPVVVLEVLGALLSVLPPEVDAVHLWTHGPEIGATRIRNTIYKGYRDENAP